MPEQDPDATVKARSPLAARSGMRGHIAKALNPVVLFSGLAALVGLGAAAYLLFSATAPAPVNEGQQSPTSGLPMPSPGPRLIFPHRGEDEILAQQALLPTAAWFAPNPLIWVVDYPDLRSQGSAFNRMAAYIEKAGLPRDRVLSDRELSAAILSDGATPETFYYGHDYRISDVVRFFAMADRQKIELSPQEELLRSLLFGARGFVNSPTGAIISIPREGSDSFVDASGRASLLRHELSHGEYFTTPAYAEFCRHFWTNEMTESDRNGFRHFLVRQGYDATDEDLLINEMQAHLMHTTDARYFNARESGLSSIRIKTLRLQFAAGMPAGWLKDAVRTVVTKLP